MSSQNHKLISFGEITVDRENFRVLKAGTLITLTPRAFDVLVVLVEHAGTVVEKQELFDRVWGETHVTDNALTKIIKEIRHTLDDDANAPRYVETVPKRGYRFIGKVEEESDRQISQVQSTVQRQPKPLPRFAISRRALVLSIAGLIVISALAGWFWFRQRPVESTSSPIRSIAVLPLKPLNAESRDESLEMGMAETLTTRLSNLQQIVVRPMSAVRKYTELQQDPVKAGREVQADAVLDGSIQKVGNRVRVTVRLIDVRDGKAVWSEQFDEIFTDIFKVQDSITERISSALMLQLSRQEKERLARHLTDNAEAYQLYLQAQLVWNGRRQNWIDQSLANYLQALEKDPNFALAHIGAADCYIMLSGHRRISMQDAEAKARPHIMTALKIDESLAQAHNALAELKYQYQYDWAGAETEFQKAVELNPNVAWIRQAYGWFLMSTGRFDQAAAEMDKARELDPSSLTINVGRGRLFYYSRQYDQAIQQFQSILAVEPNDASSYLSLYTIYEQKQMYPEAVDAYLKSLTLSDFPQNLREQFAEAFKVSGWEGFLLKRLEVLLTVAKTGDVEPHHFAGLYVRLGRKDEAFAWFNKAFQARDVATLQFKIEPAYDPIRNDPRYAQLLRKIGLQP
ncbi:MAG TPA: winged helix-turn-helix domain-containing protein [Pyrinomonadaceae bacterium]|nr:winged helix-turn-helix domain-containing protein [Pyrinomonadaceae bacterium]